MVEKICGPRTPRSIRFDQYRAAIGGILSQCDRLLCDLWSVEKMTLPAALIAAGGIWLSPVGNPPLFRNCSLINNLAAGGLEPAFFSILSKVTPAEKRGTVFGLASSFRMGGILLSSVLSGVVVWFSGIRVIFVVAGLFFLLLLPLHEAVRKSMAEGLAD